MTAAFIRFVPDDVDDLVAFLTGEDWPFHVGRPEAEAVRRRAADGHHDDADERTFFVKEAHHRRAWPGRDGRLYDSVAYAILRSDRETGEVTPVAWEDEPRP
ncbi:hypothetical protein ACIBQ6_35955 [Nonomuraea sp. NPDC049655]|uniref:hypothetical protein n=1 Tax=Nonomuraea sp. NPDC049655 TaxID=3364355 RepID=UPI0037B5C8B0